MKRILVIALAIVCGVAFSNSFAKKPTKQKLTLEEQTVQDNISRQGLQEQQKLDSLRLAEKLKQLELEMQMEEERHQAALEEKRKAAMEEEEMAVPCAKDAKSDDEYYGVLGIGKGHNMSAAMIDATQKAQIELLKLVGEELIDYKIDKVCQIYYQDKYGVFNVYVALKYPKMK